MTSALAIALDCLIAPIAVAQFAPSGELEIHYINVGQGGCTLIIGPNGTRILYDFGARSGEKRIVPYLRDEVGLVPSDGIDIAIVSHRDTDHYMGYRDLVRSGFDIHVANFDSGSEKSSSTIRSHWLEPATKTTAGEVMPIPVGLRISLGDGAEAVVAAANGKMIDRSEVDVSDENDKSVVLFIQYGEFHYILDGDLGAGEEDCTEHNTGQRDVQSAVARALRDRQLLPVELGVDVMHVAHHGSESSTSAEYFDIIRPEVALISVGLNQRSFLHPRVDVVERVLLGPDRPSCVEAPVVRAVFQTEDGKTGCSSTGCTSFAGIVAGDIKLSTDGRTGYRISSTGAAEVADDSDARTPVVVDQTFQFDEAREDDDDSE